MRISDWSSDVCSSDLVRAAHHPLVWSRPASALPLSLSARWPGGSAIRRSRVSRTNAGKHFAHSCGYNCSCLEKRLQRQSLCFVQYVEEICTPMAKKIGRASCRERVCQYV